MSLMGRRPAGTGFGDETAALGQAEAVLRAVMGSIVTDLRVQALSGRPATIAHLDVLHPYPLPPHPIVIYPGDSGAFATSQALEDR